MTRHSWILVAALAACGGNSGGGGQCGGGGGGGIVVGGGGQGNGGGGGGNGVCAIDAPGGGNVEYKAFTPHTRSMGDALGAYQLAVSDGDGAVACGLASDQANGLGQAGHEILVNITSDDLAPICPVGTYSIRSGCPATPMAGPAVENGCAYFRPFDATGASMGFLAATAGAVTVSGTDSSCTFDVTLSFAGTQFADTFTLVNGTGNLPWCTH